MKPPAPASHVRLSYTLTEAAQICGVSRWTMGVWVREKKIPACVVARNFYLIKREDLEKFLNDRRCVTEADYVKILDKRRTPTWLHQ